MMESWDNAGRRTNILKPDYARSYLYMVELPSYYGIIEWLKENILGGYWIDEPLQWSFEIYFELEKDAVAFKLRWL